ncbi:MAG: hypothetical protein KGL39_45125 [Patescibacteria group bacterium]|nr:hypothetical protein [Patescibacteria group bacterium]
MRKPVADLVKRLTRRLVFDQHAIPSAASFSATKILARAIKEAADNDPDSTTKYIVEDQCTG